MHTDNGDTASCDLAQVMAVTTFARNEQVEGSIPYSNRDGYVK